MGHAPPLFLSPFLPSLFLSSTPIAFLSPRSLPLALAEPCPSTPLSLLLSFATPKKLREEGLAPFGQRGTSSGPRP